MRRVRSLGEARRGRAPAVALTAYAGEADRGRALAAVFQAHVAKPVGPETLTEMIVNLAGRAVPPAWG